MNLFSTNTYSLHIFSCFYRNTTESGRIRNALGKGECFWTCLKRSPLFIVNNLTMVVLIIYMSDNQRGEITVFYVLKPKLIRIIFICKGRACTIVVFRRITNDLREPIRFADFQQDKLDRQMETRTKCLSDSFRNHLFSLIVNM